MLNEHAAGQGSGHLLVIEYYVLQHLLAIILCLKNLEPPEEGKSIEFPRKHAILADCKTIDSWWDIRDSTMEAPENYRSLLQKGPVKETIFCKRYSHMLWNLDSSIFLMEHMGFHYGVATMSRVLKIIGLFCKRAIDSDFHDSEENLDSWESTLYICVTNSHRTYRILRVDIPDGTYGMLQFANQTLLCGSVKSIGVRCEFVTHICPMWVRDTYI